MSDARSTIETYLSERDIRYERVSDGDWAIQLKGEKKLSITVLFALRERTLQVESFFIRRPAENHADLYLDRVLGAILQTSDELFMPAIEIGFASYLKRDLAWRAAQGIPSGPPRADVRR